VPEPELAAEDAAPEDAAALEAVQLGLF
jgi:hypothetical protein